MGRALDSILILLLGALGYALPTLGYPTPVDFDGTLQSWPLTAESGDVPYAVDAESQDDLAQYTDLVDEAATVWSHAGGGHVAYKKAEDGDAPRVTIHLVRRLKNGDFAAGYTTFDGFDAKGRPTHCSIFIHVSDGYSYNGIAKTILHELGHGLGLGHSLVPQAIMSYSLEQNKFALDIDDEAAIARLYPGDGTEPRVPLGCAVRGQVGPTGTGVLGVETVLLLLPLLLRLFPLFQPIASIRSIERLARTRRSSGTFTSY